MLLLARPFVRFALFSMCLVACVNPARAEPLPSPGFVKIKAMKTQEKCFQELNRSLKASGGDCGNSGCGAIFSSCYVRGETVVTDAIEVAIKRSSSQISENCLTGINSLANEATNDNPWLERILKDLPVDLDGDPFILYRLYFYELIYKTVASPGCKRSLRTTNRSRKRIVQIARLLSLSLNVRFSKYPISALGRLLPDTA